MPKTLLTASKRGYPLFLQFIRFFLLFYVPANLFFVVPYRINVISPRPKVLISMLFEFGVSVENHQCV